MKMETVKSELERWGELIIATDGGTRFEIHLGDTEFDTQNRLIRLNAPEAQYLIDGDAIEVITKHYGHRKGDEG